MVVVMVRGELKCVIRECGQLWMGTTGIIMMLVCCVVNWDMMISVRIAVKNIDINFSPDTTIQGLLPLEMMKVVNREWSTDTTVVGLKSHFSHVHRVHTRLLMLKVGTVLLQLQLSANKME